MSVQFDCGSGRVRNTQDLVNSPTHHDGICSVPDEPKPRSSTRPKTLDPDGYPPVFPKPLKPGLVPDSTCSEWPDDLKPPYVMVQVQHK